MPLVRLIYISESQFDLAEGSAISQLGSILSVSNRNNRALSLTGALIYDDGWFMQSLEGEREVVWNRFERISADERHGGVIVFEMKEVAERAFGSWSMGLAQRKDNREAFAPHLRNGRLYPKELTAVQIFDMMQNTARRGLQEKMPKAA